MSWNHEVDKMSKTPLLSNGGDWMYSYSGGYWRSRKKNGNIENQKITMSQYNMARRAYEREMKENKKMNEAIGDEVLKHKRIADEILDKVKVPWKNVNYSLRSYSINISLDDREKWMNGIFHNSRYAIFIWDPIDLTFQLIGRSPLLKRTKFIKRNKIDSIEKVIKFINDYVKRATSDNEIIHKINEQFIPFLFEGYKKLILKGDVVVINTDKGKVRGDAMRETKDGWIIFADSHDKEFLATEDNIHSVFKKIRWKNGNTTYHPKKV